MKRLAKILQSESVVPEFNFFVFTEHGAIAYNGQLGINYSLSKVGNRLANLVKQHGRFAILDGTMFLKVVSVLEQVSEATIDKSASLLRIEANNGKTKIAIPISLTLHDELPHLKINWMTHSGKNKKSTEIANLWNDTIDLISSEGVALWGDVIGVYEAPNFTASFDYGVLLYKEKEAQSGKGVHFCPKALLDLGLQDVNKAVFNQNGVYAIGDDVKYYTSAVCTTSVLDQLLTLRDKVDKKNEKAVTLDFSSGLWRRAKVFNKLVLTLKIHDGIMTLYGGDWSEIIGTTAAPNGTFVTRISLLQRWTTGTLGHRIYVGDNGAWTLYGKTRNGSEFFGNLTEVDNTDAIGEETDFANTVDDGLEESTVLL